MIFIVQLGFLLQPGCLALTAGDRKTLISPHFFNALFLSEARGCVHTCACRWVGRGVCGSLLSLTALWPSVHPELLLTLYGSVVTPQSVLTRQWHWPPLLSQLWCDWAADICVPGEDAHWGDPKLLKWTWAVLIASVWDACVSHDTYQALKSHSRVLPLPNFDFLARRHDPW